MPNAHEYRDGAARFRALGDVYLRQAALVSGWPVASHLGAGPVADAVSAGLGRSAGELVDAAAEMARLAGVCDTRAEVCEAYRRRVVEYERDPLLRLALARPVPPYPWVSW